MNTERRSVPPPPRPPPPTSRSLTRNWSIPYHTSLLDTECRIQQSFKKWNNTPWGFFLNFILFSSLMFSFLNSHSAAQVMRLSEQAWTEFLNYPASILYKSIAGRYRPVRVADGPLTARYRFIKNAYWVPYLRVFCEKKGTFENGERTKETKTAASVLFRIIICIGWFDKLAANPLYHRSDQNPVCPMISKEKKILAILW